MALSLASIKETLRKVPVLRALRHRDFFLLWIGAILSFTGSQVQSVAQGYYVFEVTGSEAKLAMVMFSFTVPVFFLAPFAGILPDFFNRKFLLVASMVTNAVGAAFMGVMYLMGNLEYEHILAVSALTGIVQTVEAPTRQSVVRAIVGDEDLPAAIPAQAMTFNLARVAGPALGGFLAAVYGPGHCFLINAVSFFFLVLAVVLIRTDLSPVVGQAGRTADLLVDGIRYTFRNLSLRTLFFMEAATSIFCIFYMSQMPAIAKTKLGLDERGLGLAMSFVGFGALTGLLLVSNISGRPIKPLLTRIAMTSCSVGILLLSFVHTPLLAYPVFFLLGSSTIVQFNSTNTLFQLLSPENLRGRVISMHLWAIAGLSPFGIYLFGQIAERVGLDEALMAGGSLQFVAAMVAWGVRKNVPPM